MRGSTPNQQTPLPTLTGRDDPISAKFSPHSDPHILCTFVSREGTDPKAMKRNQ